MKHYTLALTKNNNHQTRVHFIYFCNFRTFIKSPAIVSSQNKKKKNKKTPHPFPFFSNINNSFFFSAVVFTKKTKNIYLFVYLEIFLVHCEYYYAHYHTIRNKIVQYRSIIRPFFFLLLLFTPSNFHYCGEKPCRPRTFSIVEILN